MFKWWRKRQRAIDLQILWPVCVQKAPDINIARRAFMLHCINDSAWNIDFTEEELRAYIDKLEPR